MLIESYVKRRLKLEWRKSSISSNWNKNSSGKLRSKRGFGRKPKCKVLKSVNAL